MVRPPQFERGDFNSGGESGPGQSKPLRPSAFGLAWVGSVRAQFTDRTFRV